MISGQLLLSVDVTNDLFISQQSQEKCMPKSSAMSSIICFFNNSDVLLECMCHGRVAGRTRETRGKVNNGI